MQSQRMLFAKNIAYEALVARLGRRRRLAPEQVVEDVEHVANLAYMQHPGVFADGRVENVLLGFNEQVSTAAQRFQEVDCFSGRERSRVLHVASEVYQVGGHSRVLAKWVDRDSASNHCVVLTRQTAELPPVLVSTCQAHGVKVIALPVNASKVDRAGALRKLSKQADRVILHHNPDDAVPILAFACNGGPPVAFFNHAHFWYSLGGTVADITLNTLPYFLELTRRYRFPKAAALLSGMLGTCTYSPRDKSQAKRDLGLDDRTPVLLTIGSEHYFRPGNGYDFFVTLQKLLGAFDALQVLVIGPRVGADFVPPALVRDKRVRFFGAVADPVPCYQAADLCLESFPHSSLGGFVEAVLYGAAFPIPSYAEHESILHVDLPPLSSVSPRARNEAEYMKSITDRLADLSQTRGLAAELQKRLWTIDREWPAVLRGIYSKMDLLAHTPGPIPEGRCAFESDHQLLASLKTFRIPAEIHARIPYLEAVRLNLKLATQQGLASVCSTLAYECYYFCTRIRHR